MRFKPCLVLALKVSQGQRFRNKFSTTFVMPMREVLWHDNH
jgi:hypothetical protein